MSKIYNPDLDREQLLIEDVGTTDDGFIKIKFTNTEFNDIIFTLGKVEFDEQDECVLHFDYDIHEGTIPDDKVELFEQTLGDFILQAIVRGIEKNELVYGGGVDENRDNDTEQPGT